jgi:hypothetical protein
MACCFAGRRGDAAPAVQRCSVAVTAQLGGPSGNARLSNMHGEGARTSGAAASQLAAAAEGGADGGSSRPFTPPVAFPGLSTAVADCLERLAAPRGVHVDDVRVAPAPGSLSCVLITMQAELTFAQAGCAEAAAWRERVAGEGVDALEDAVATAVAEAAPPVPNLGVINAVVISAQDEGKHEGASVRRARRPSTVALRVSYRAAAAQEPRPAPPAATPPSPAGA